MNHGRAQTEADRPQSELRRVVISGDGSHKQTASDCNPDHPRSFHEREFSPESWTQSLRPTASSRPQSHSPG